MSGTTAPPLADLSEAQLLDHVEEQHQLAVSAEREIFRSAYQWAVIHNPERLGKDAGEDGRPGREKARRVGGPGTPLVTQFSAAAFGARVGKSPFAAQRMIADALDVYLRLPLIAERVEAGEVKVSYARHVADATRELSEAEAAHVDEQVVESSDGRLSWTRFETLVEAKVKAAAPELARQREEEAAQATFAKKLRTEHAGMATFMVRADIATIDQIDGCVTALAKKVAESMPGASDDERRVHAVRILVHPAADESTPIADLMPRVQLFVHVCPDGDGVARVEGHGPVTEAWASRVLGPSCRIKVTPVLDLAGQAPVDAYEIPARHRTAVHLMTPADVFPFATSTSRAMEIDHTEPFAEGGPSAIGNYGPMTKRHHRIKTHAGWDVRQPFPGIYLWRDPYGAHYLVDHTGTRRIADPPPCDEPITPAELHFTRFLLDLAA